MQEITWKRQKGEPKKAYKLFKQFIQYPNSIFLFKDNDNKLNEYCIKQCFKFDWLDRKEDYLDYIDNLNEVNERIKNSIYSKFNMETLNQNIKFYKMEVEILNMKIKQEYDLTKESYENKEPIKERWSLNAYKTLLECNNILNELYQIKEDKETLTEFEKIEKEYKLGVVELC
ncbi:MAG: hypothetical protein LBM96_13210 [Methanobrevibacter sp.]|jgi:hypothetical protein|nr:hypothetical protein [Candidatus Methanoflexus mossambicus]